MQKYVVRLEFPEGVEEACYNSQAKGLAAIGALVKEYESSAERISMLDVSTGRLISFTLRSGEVRPEFPALEVRKRKRKSLPAPAPHPNTQPF